MKRLRALGLACVLAVSALVAPSGCGSDDEGGGGTSKAGAAGDAAPDTSTGGKAGGTGGGGTGGTSGTGASAGSGGTAADAGLDASDGEAGSAGQGGTCSDPSECPDTGNECIQATCDAGKCGTENVAAGTPTANQVAGDCQQVQCDGSGATESVPDDSDPFDDGKQCTSDGCAAGSPTNTPLTAGSACSESGGKVCDGQGACVECVVNADCASLVCQSNTCVAAQCIDQVKNGQETDVDCGGPQCGKCSDGKGCAVTTDCQSGVCSGSPKVCQAATCTDTVKNGTETDIDCGGSCSTKCGPGKGCSSDADCVGGKCSGSTCLPTCTDGVKNNGETDVDCGGPNCTQCQNGKSCSAASDCTSGFCSSGTSTACINASDCGSGKYCAAGVCVGQKPNGQTCAASVECSSGNCPTQDGVCCDAPCTSACQACTGTKKGGGADGVCGNVQSGTDPDDECAQQPASSCGTTGVCGSGACALQPTGTVCAAQSCTGGSQQNQDTCNGTGTCVDGGSVACAPYVCGATACKTSCTSDADCSSGNYCAAGTCIAKKSNGSPCLGASDCQSGFCTDGVCCNEACGGACRACTGAKKGSGFDGACGNITAGADPDNECTDQGASSCGTSGACSGSGSCAFYAAGTVCVAQSCTGGTQQNADTCNGTGTCVDGGTTACSPYVCGATGCKTTCTTDADCASGNYCASGGSCVAKKANGQICGGSNECTSGACSDGFCCNDACTGGCNVCAAALGASANGTCTLLPSGATGSPSCNPYVCSGTSGACPTSCTSSAQCVPGSVCSAGACVGLKAQGQPCAANGECASGLCVDGVCCNTPCLGTCQACTAAKKGSGSDGTCGNIGVGSDPDAECPDQGATSCGTSGSCSGSGSCALYPSGTICAAQSCSGGTQQNADTCNGAGVCVDGGSVSCGAYACGGNACKTSCASDADCSAGNYCVGSSCVPKKSNGQTCSSGTECASSFCADGVCCNTACSGSCDVCNATPGTCTVLPAGSAGNPSCGAFVCDGVSGNCPVLCSNDTQCAPGNFCSGSICAPKKANGQLCSGPNQCSSNFCVDGVCCNSACTGTCVACSLFKKGSGSDGTCGPIGSGMDPDNECATQTPSTCGTTGVCSGSSSCALYPSGTTCTPPTCSGGVQQNADSCDGGGTCVDGGSVVCAPYTCGPSACKTTCINDTDCATGNFCVGGACIGKKGNGQSCSSASECQSNYCVDGYCCNSACNGSCDVCNATPGTCTLVAAGSAGNPSCSPFVCDGVSNVCPIFCTSSSQCATGYFCQANSCVLKKANGAACASSAECSSTFCVDGVCCNTACSGTCSACSAAKKGTGSDGTCGTVNAGTDPDNECADQGATSCGTNGVCSGSASCAFYSPGTVCAAASCNGTIAKQASACDGLGTCVAGSSKDCSPYQCVAPATCLTSCTADTQCASGYYCDLTLGQCIGKLGTGSVCSSNNQCASGNCQQGQTAKYCATVTCTTCQVVSSSGTSCIPAAAGSDPKNECVANVANCISDACNGSGACTAPNGTSCGASTCVAPNGLTSYSCQGGTCTSSTTSCSPYICAGGACLTTCTNDTQCVSGYYCDGTVGCVPKLGTGAVCGSNNQCLSGNCQQGQSAKYCATVTCLTCQVVTSSGTSCVPAVSGSDPKNECVANVATCIADNCNGNGACTAPAGTSCGASACVGANSLASYTCSSSGTCTSSTTNCSPYICVSGACLTSCTANNQCASGFYCKSSQCVPKLAQGSACTTAGECQSGYCTDGFCCNQDCKSQCTRCNQPPGQCTNVPNNQPPTPGHGFCSGPCGNVCNGFGQCCTNCPGGFCWG